MRIRLGSMILGLLLCGALVGCSAGESSAASSRAAVDGIESGGDEISAEYSPQAAEPDFPASYMVETKNEFDYQPGLECSAFASAYLLRHYGTAAKGLELFADYPDKVPDGTGVFPWGVTNFFLEQGYNAEFLSAATADDLRREVAKGAPVIVFIHIEEPYTSVHNTHYIPVVGYDEDSFYFAESVEEQANCKEEEGVPYNRKTDVEKFERLWTNVEGSYTHPYYRISPKEKAE